MDIEKIIISLIFFNKIKLSEYEIEEYMFLNKNYKKYINFIKESSYVQINEINQIYLSKNHDFQYQISKIEELKDLAEKFNLKTLLEMFYKNSIENLFREKLNLLKDSPNDRNLLEDIEIVLTDLNNLLKNLKANKKENVTAVSKYREYITKVLIDKENGILNEGIVGLSSGIQEFDLITKGFKKPEYILLAGRPSMGKTSLSLDIAAENILAGKNVLIFSIEMPRAQIIARLLPKINRTLNLENTLFCKDYEGKKEEIENALNLIENSNLEIEDFSEKTKVTIFDIENITNSYIERHGSLDLAILDYIQKMSSDLKTSDENIVLTDISKKLALIIKRTNAPWIVLSQLSRNLESRIDKRPQNSDLRGSGALEQDADIIIFPFRENIYIERNLREEIQKKPDNLALRESLENLLSLDIENAEIIISKNRNGAIGSINVQFHKKSASYVSIGTYEAYEEIVNF